LVYLFVMLAALLAGGIYAWQHHEVTSLKNKQKLLLAQNQVLQTQVKILSAPVAGATNNNSPLQYKDWKTYCDSINNSCFRYPKEWTIDGNSTSTKASVALGTTNGTVRTQYNDPVTTQALNQVYYIVDIKDLNKKDLGLKVVARVIGNTPDYVIVDGSYLETNHIAAGKSLSFMDDARFTSKTTKTSAQLFAKPSGQILSNLRTTDQAQAWFKTDDAKNCLQVLQSYYYQ
jgi:hypothetical protein